MKDEQENDLTIYKETLDKAEQVFLVCKYCQNYNGVTNFCKKHKVFCSPEFSCKGGK